MNEPREKRKYTKRVLPETQSCDSIRLELVRLCYRHDHSPEQIIERSDKLLAYVTAADKG